VFGEQLLLTGAQMNLILIIHCVPKKLRQNSNYYNYTACLIRIKYPLSGFNYHLSDLNVANFNKIHRTVSEQQL